jgi:hypothetical protein
MQPRAAIAHQLVGIFQTDSDRATMLVNGQVNCLHDIVVDVAREHVRKLDEQ